MPCSELVSIWMRHWIAPRTGAVPSLSAVGGNVLPSARMKRICHAPAGAAAWPAFPPYHATAPATAVERRFHRHSATPDRWRHRGRRQGHGRRATPPPVPWRPSRRPETPGHGVHETAHNPRPCGWRAIAPAGHRAGRKVHCPKPDSGHRPPSRRYRTTPGAGNHQSPRAACPAPCITPCPTICSRLTPTWVTGPGSSRWPSSCAVRCCRCPFTPRSPTRRSLTWLLRCVLAVIPKKEESE